MPTKKDPRPRSDVERRVMAINRGPASSSHPSRPSPRALRQGSFLSKRRSTARLSPQVTPLRALASSSPRTHSVRPRPLTPLPHGSRLTAHGRSARCDSLVDKKKEGRKRRWRSCCARGAVLRARGIGVVGAGVLTATRVARSGAGRTIRRCART